jgi:hypothetical protein
MQDVDSRAMGGKLEDGQVRCGERVISLQQLYEATPLPDKLHVSRKVYGTPRSTAFLAHGFRIAVHRVTGEIRAALFITPVLH